MDKVWQLKEEVCSVLFKKYDDYTRFHLSEHPYHLTYATFYLWNHLHLNFSNQQTHTEEGTIWVKGSDITIVGSGANAEEAIVNLIKKTLELTKNTEIKELLNNFQEGN